MKRPRSTGATWLLGLALIVGLPASSAHAQPAADAEAAKAEAARAFEAGRKLWDAKDAAGALPLFQKAVEQSGSPNARLYYARCLRETGDVVKAHDEMARTVRDARDRAGSDERYVATRDAAAAELALLEARVGKLVITLDSTLAGASVTLQGAAIDPSSLGKPVTVAPGSVKVVARPSEGAAVEQDVTVGAGATQSVTLARVAAAAPEPVKPSPPPPVGDAEGGGFGVLRGVGIGVAAIGVGGLVAFGVGTAQANDKLATLEAECGAGPCPDDSHADLISSGKTAETVAFVGLGIGITGVVAGALMIAFGGPDDPASAPVGATRDGFRVRF